jgi:hypothetical protein
LIIVTPVQRVSIADLRKKIRRYLVFGDPWAEPAGRGYAFMMEDRGRCLGVQRSLANLVQQALNLGIAAAMPGNLVAA